MVMDKYLLNFKRKKREMKMLLLGGRKVVRLALVLDYIRRITGIATPRVTTTIITITTTLTKRLNKRRRSENTQRWFCILKRLYNNI